MNRALIGYTGFVGGNLYAQGSYSDLFRSSNIGDIAGRSFDRVVCAGVKAAKWIANQEPAADRAGIKTLTQALESVTAREFVLISTVDVYPRPIDVDESVIPRAEDAQPYGRHRYELEQFVRSRFEKALIVRLPGLFGTGLKKNAIYDFLHDNRLDLIHQDGVFQFYDLDRIHADVERCLAAGLELVNFATEPVAVRDIARIAFQKDFVNTMPPPAPRYDFKTRHARTWNREGDYLATKDEVLASIARFVARERGVEA